MSVLELVSWDCISFQELDTLLRVGIHPSGTLDIDKSLRSGLTPLCVACKHNREDLVSLLLHYGAHIDKACSFLQKQPLHFACDHSSRNLGIVRKILDAGADTNAVDEDGNTGMHLACTESNLPVVKLLVEHKADVNILDIDGESPLVRACFARSIELIDFLLQSGSDPNMSGGQPVEIVVRATCVDALKLLVDSGADIQQGAYLCHAAEHGHIEMMKTLHNYGADVNKANDLGMTPLHVTCYSDQTNLTAANLLLHWGARVDAHSSMRQTALHYACNIQDLGKIRLLLAYGANVTAQDSLQLSPLLMSLTGPWSERGTVIVRLLLATGAYLTHEMLERWRSPINLLQSTGEKRQELLEVLEEHVSCPMSLQGLCRIRIRRLVHPNIDNNLISLPLPSQMVRYLKFLDILGHHVKS